MAEYRGIARALACAAWAFASSVALAANPPAAVNGLAWLAQQVQSNGSVAGEASSIATPFQARAEALATLNQLSTPPATLALAVAGESASATEYAARQVITLAPLGRDVSAPLAALAAAQNGDGGFGGSPGYQSNPLDTGFAILALKAAGSSSATAAANAVRYLTASQAADGSFAINEQPSVYQDLQPSERSGRYILPRV